MDERLSVGHTYAVRKELFRRHLPGAIWAYSYLAYDEQLEDEVVIEHVSLLGQDDEAQDEAWLRQYRSIAVKVMRLRHPNHVAIRDFWTDFRTAFFLVKQYEAGSTLDRLLQTQDAAGLSPQVRIGLCKDLLRGLAALHAGNVLHRDIKPNGVYVAQGHDRVAQIDNYHLAVSAAGVYLDDPLIGTPVYLAPELIAGEPRRYSRQSDVYAAGLVCLEILSGKDIQDLLRQEGCDLAGGLAALLEWVHARGGHVREKTIRELLAGPQAEAVCCATHTDPRERFADAQCFHDSFALNAPLRIARHTDPSSPDSLSTHLARLPDSGYRTELLGAYRIASIDARMALGKCRQIAEAVAREAYTHHVGEPKSKPLVNLVEELADRHVLPPDVFTHFYNVRRQGNAALHGSAGGPSGPDEEAVLTMIGATLQIVGWHLSRSAV
jgi:serine/threonine protein kinase